MIQKSKIFYELCMDEKILSMNYAQILFRFFDIESGIRYEWKGQDVVKKWD